MAKIDFNNIKSFLTILAIAAVSLATVAADAAGIKPNVVLIVSDDQGYADVGCALTTNADHNQNFAPRTPPSASWPLVQFQRSTRSGAARVPASL